jgi:hypothetical protein
MFDGRPFFSTRDDATPKAEHHYGKATLSQNHLFAK